MPDYSDEVPFGETRLGFVDNFDDAQEFMRWLGNRRDVLGFDTETSGLDPREPGARIRIAQFGDINEGWTIDYQKWPGLVQEVLERYQGDIVLHNAKFDYSWLAVHAPGIVLPWSRTHDTMIQARLNDNEGSAALKTLGVKNFGKEAAIGQKMLDEGMQRNGWTWDTVPLEFEPYSQYAALDTVLTARMHRRFSHIHSGEFRRAYELEMQALRICTNMELRGIRVDLDHVRRRQTELNQYVEQTIKYCEKTYGVKIGSTKQLGEWFKERDAPLTEFTATGAAKMDADTLEMLIANGYDLAKYALNARKATKISSTYLDNMIKFADSENILHAEINTMAARTGRMSIQRPALQTLPRDDKHVRPSVIPFEGQKLVSADYDQQELRLIAGLSGDTVMIDAFRQADTVGPDFFTQSARELFSDETIIKSDPRRNTTKSYWYSSAYGAGVKKQALTAGIPEAEMRVIVETVKERYSTMDRWKGSVVSRLETMRRSGERPYVTLYDGRRLYMDPERTYAAVNYTVQGSCAIMVKESLVNLDHAGLSEYMLLPVHDEILFSIPENDIPELAPIINEAMFNNEFGIDIVAEAGEPMSRWVKQ